MKTSQKYGILCVIGAVILYYIEPHWYSMLLGLGGVGIFFNRDGHMDKDMLEKVKTKIQYDTRIYNHPKLIKKICLKAYDENSLFNDKMSFINDYLIDQAFYHTLSRKDYIEDKDLYTMLKLTIIQMKSKKEKWYGRFYSKRYWEALNVIHYKFCELAASQEGARN